MKIKLQLYGASRDLSEKNFIEFNLDGKSSINDLKKKGINDCHLEGHDSNDWKLIDAIDIIIHIFHPEKRKFYNLERMWSELIPRERLTI